MGMQFRIRSELAAAALGICGTGIAMAFPEERELGIAIALLGGLVFLFSIRIDGLNVRFGRFLRWKFKLNPYFIVAAISGLICAGAIGGYFWDRAQGPIIWIWGAASPIAFWGSTDEPLMVSGINIKGQNRWEKPLMIITASIRSDRTLKETTLSIVKDGQLRTISGDVIEPGQVFFLGCRNSDINEKWKEKDPYAEAFKAYIPKFTFKFYYHGGPSYEISFIESDLDKFISKAQIDNRAK